MAHREDEIKATEQGNLAHTLTAASQNNVYYYFFQNKTKNL